MTEDEFEDFAEDLFSTDSTDDTDDTEEYDSEEIKEYKTLDQIIIERNRAGYKSLEMTFQVNERFASAVRSLDNITDGLCMVYDADRRKVQSTLLNSINIMTGLFNKKAFIELLSYEMFDYKQRKKFCKEIKRVVGKEKFESSDCKIVYECNYYDLPKKTEFEDSDETVVLHNILSNYRVEYILDFECVEAKGNKTLIRFNVSDGKMFCLLRNGNSVDVLGVYIGTLGVVNEDLRFVWVYKKSHENMLLSEYDTDYKQCNYVFSKEKSELTLLSLRANCIFKKDLDEHDITDTIKIHVDNISKTYTVKTLVSFGEETKKLFNETQELDELMTASGLFSTVTYFRESLAKAIFKCNQVERFVLEENNYLNKFFEARYYERDEVIDKLGETAGIDNKAYKAFKEYFSDNEDMYSINNIMDMMVCNIIDLSVDCKTEDTWEIEFTVKNFAKSFINSYFNNVIENGNIIEVYEITEKE